MSENDVAKRTIRLLLAIESAAFITAALAHLGVWISGYEHRKAAIAESVIGIVLAIGLVWTWIRPAAARSAGLIAQGFALFGTLVGLVTIALGIGPRTVPDLEFHTAIVATLVIGLWRVAHGRVRAPAAPGREGSQAA